MLYLSLSRESSCRLLITSKRTLSSCLHTSSILSHYQETASSFFVASKQCTPTIFFWEALPPTPIILVAVLWRVLITILRDMNIIIVSDLTSPTHEKFGQAALVRATGIIASLSHVNQTKNNCSCRHLSILNINFYVKVQNIAGSVKPACKVIIIIKFSYRWGGAPVSLERQDLL